MTEPSSSELPPQDESPPNISSLSAASSERSALTTPQLGERIAAEVGIDEKQALRAVQIVQEYSQEYSGPIPSAADLKQLNQVSPDLGTDIAKDFLAHRAHERNMDLQMVTLASADSVRKDGWLSYARRGQSFGILSQCIFVLSALWAMYLHHLVLAGLFVAGPALGVVAQFIRGMSAEASKPASREGKNHS